MPRALRGVCAAIVLAMALLAGAPSIQAATPEPADVDGEIAQLLAHLGRSGCRFQRNGAWHDAAEARAHLQRKYRHAKKRDRIASTEDFIAGAATASSLSGRAYSVQCADAAEVPSAQWLGEALQKIRAQTRQP
jgi:hypothetical protein